MAGKVRDAVALLKGAGRHLDAARLVLATLQSSQVGRTPFINDCCTWCPSQPTPAEARALYCQAARIVLESPTGATGDAGLLSTCWRGALAAHWIHTSGAALQAGNVDVAVRAGLAASHYTVREAVWKAGGRQSPHLGQGVCTALVQHAP